MADDAPDRERGEPPEEMPADDLSAEDLEEEMSGRVMVLLLAFVVVGVLLYLTLGGGHSHLH
ncbi:MAG: hypothetical protein IRY97_04940 [Thermomicrobiaceae bacterium]|nr:hypothetical protein [Thermomicrobiaceae bacterium]